jgi:hypothetical protein
MKSLRPYLGAPHGGGFEYPEEALPVYLAEIYDTLLVVLEAADLPETRKRLIEKWQGFEGGGIGKTQFYDQYDYMESKPFDYLKTLVNGLRISVGEREDSLEAFELSKLEMILRATPTLLHRRQKEPRDESEIQEVMHDYLRAFFPQYNPHVRIQGVIRGFEPDGGVRNLKAAIEFKFATSRSEVSKALGGIFEDISGYKSLDWTRFYTVLYQTEAFESEDRFKLEISRIAPLTWTPILVTGAGTREQRGSARRTKKK